MKQFNVPSAVHAILLLVILFIAEILFRPLLPIDETRYMSAAWEMYLRQDWLAPLTVNFQPYHHKPPLLFWLINISWEFFGVSRVAGMIPVFLAALATLLISQKLEELLFPERQKIHHKVPLILMGSLPFLIYSLMIMFDITLAVFTGLSILALLSFALTEKRRYLVLLSLTLGLGVLTKGPVAWLYVLFPMVFGPLWHPARIKPLKWYVGCAGALLLSVIPVSFWIVPVLTQSSGDFAYWLLWEQTAGRITGNFSAAHSRPFWFYLPILPLFFLPWILFGSVWKKLSGVWGDFQQNWLIRFLALWIVPTLVSFSLISGKQPHYLVPLLPGMAILLAFWIEIRPQRIRNVAFVMVGIFVLGQGIAAKFLFPRYDLRPLATFLEDYKDRDWAYGHNYQGEITFLGRLEKPVAEIETNTAKEWFTSHPNGLIIMRYEDEPPLPSTSLIFEMPYRSKNLGVFNMK
ncbi:ArnT family glycosyltransferase [Sneathiella limimaris]|uniref:ArnT family glycosyltransferase n=1 Tax=Sneathiella limimaris TaxID=1964213 RepID=UPI00146AC1D1|nr:glycosyltransferase family 39 protein [Sneathiella limimaris]